MQNLSQEYKNVGFDEGPANAGEPQIEPAEIAAKNLEKLIHDQLEESSAITTLRHVFFEQCLLGTGVLKGPFTFDKSYHAFEETEEGDSIHIKKIKSVPKIEAVSCWDLYPDPNATNINDCDYVIQRHSYNKQQFEDLADNSKSSIDMSNADLIASNWLSSCAFSSSGSTLIVPNILNLSTKIVTASETAYSGSTLPFVTTFIVNLSLFNSLPTLIFSTS